jgi:menaquinone-dependent protoporphyrinogen oxidase
VNEEMVTSLIIFDTKLGSTQKVAQWIGEGMNGISKFCNVNDVESLDYDLIVIGSPIYMGKPLPSIDTFLEKNRNILAKKKVALFIVCLDYPHPEYASDVSQFLQDFEKQIDITPVTIQAFGGYLDLKDLDEKERGGMRAFLKSRGWPIPIMDSLDKEAVVAFGQKISASVD